MNFHRMERARQTTRGSRLRVFGVVLACRFAVLFICAASFFLIHPSNNSRVRSFGRAYAQSGKPAATPTPAPSSQDAKRNQRDSSNTQAAPDDKRANATSTSTSNSASGASNPQTQNVPATYFYEFTSAQFDLRLVRIEHDERGVGKVIFRRKDSPEEYTEKIALSEVALERTRAVWTKLNFIDSTRSYDSEKDFSHLGTIKLGMRHAGRERFTELHYPADPDAFALVNEYRRITEQTLFIFDITVARESQPLEAPKVMTRLERLVARQGVSDPTQLTVLLQDLSTDERLPLIARNQATKLLKKIKKSSG